MGIYAFILCIAAIVMLTFKKLGQPLVLGYLVAGFLLSPNMDYMSVIGFSHNHFVEVEEIGKIGVTVIMFCLGLEFSFKKLGTMGISPFLTAFIIIFCMISTGYFLGYALGWSQMDCVFLGGMLSMSSTAIIYKSFNELGLSRKAFTSKVMSVLILEDIIGIVLLVLLSATAHGVEDPQEILGTVLHLAMFVVISLVLGLIILPWFLRKTRSIMNEEMMLIFSMALMFSLSWCSQKLGFSEAFGAFIMGSILAETHESHKIEHCIAPIKNYLGAIFFISVGMLVDARIIAEYWQPTLFLVLAIIIGQMIFGTIGFGVGRMSLKDAMQSGFSMGQIGELSFIIAGVGVAVIGPDGNPVISKFLYPVIVAVSVITTFFTPYMIRAALPAYELAEKIVPHKFIKFMEKRADRKHSKAYKPRTVIGDFAVNLFKNAKIQTGNLPTFCGTDITSSLVVINEKDIFDGKTTAEVNSIEEIPFIAMAVAPTGNNTWVDLEPDHVFKAGEKVWVTEKTKFSKDALLGNSNAKPAQ